MVSDQYPVMSRVFVHLICESRAAYKGGGGTRPALG